MLSRVGPNGKTEKYFGNGWSDLVNDNQILNGEAMVFEYYGNSVFRLVVFGCNYRSKDFKEGSHMAVPGGWSAVGSLRCWVARAEREFTMCSRILVWFPAPFIHGQIDRRAYQEWNNSK